MAYIDIAPTAPARGRVVVLFHGKNFCAATWGDTARALAARGYRVIVPDQIGFRKPSKPTGCQYSVAGLASLSRDLPDRVGADRPVLVGHSTGGLIAMRYAVLFPDRLSSLMLVNPLGLNDTLVEGVPYTHSCRAAVGRGGGATVPECTTGAIERLGTRAADRSPDRLSARTPLRDRHP